MTKEEYIKTIPSDAWSDHIHDLAQQQFERLWACGSVASDAMEEFNNDAYDFFIENGIRTGQIKEEEEDK